MGLVGNVGCTSLLQDARAHTALHPRGPRAQPCVHPLSPSCPRPKAKMKVKIHLLPGCGPESAPNLPNTLVLASIGPKPLGFGPECGSGQNRPQTSPDRPPGPPGEGVLRLKAKIQIIPGTPRSAKPSWDVINMVRYQPDLPQPEFVSLFPGRNLEFEFATSSTPII